MVLISESRINADRFTTYVEELQDFARSYRMKVGAPEDLRELLVALNGPGPFREDCASMLRSIVYRERGHAPPEELLALTAAAWGGPEVNSAAASLQEPLGGILIFLNGVMRVRPDNPPPLRSQEVEVREPAPTYTNLPRRTSGIYDAAAQTAAATRPATETVPPVAEPAPVIDATPTLHARIRALEADSPDVRLYVQLLQRRKEQEAAQPLPEITAELILLPTLPLREEQPPEPVFLDATAPSPPYDPWDENSELQQELRKFAAERDARAAAARAAQALRDRHRLLFTLESVLSRLTKPNNPMRRYLARRADATHLPR